MIIYTRVYYVSIYKEKEEHKEKDAFEDEG